MPNLNVILFYLSTVLARLTKSPQAPQQHTHEFPKPYFFSNPPLMYTTGNYYYSCRAIDPPVGALDGPALSYESLCAFKWVF